MKQLIKSLMPALLTAAPLCAYGAELSELSADALSSIGQGENECVVMLSFETDSRCVDNVAFRLLYDGELDYQRAETLLQQIAATDSRFDYNNGRFTLDLNSDKEFNQNTDLSADSWTVIDTGSINGIPTIKVQSGQPETGNPIFYLPAADAKGVWLPTGMSAPLQDGQGIIRAYVQFDGTFTSIQWRASKVNTKYQSDNTKITLANRSTDKYSANINYKTVTGTTYIQCRPAFKDNNKTQYLESNFCEYTVEEPLRPITNLYWEEENLEVGLQKDLTSYLRYEPEDATYTKMEYTSDNTKVVTKTMRSTLTEGEANITAKYSYIPDPANPIVAEAKVSVHLQVPIENVTFDFLEDSGAQEIQMEPRRIKLLRAKIEPENADIQQLAFEIVGHDINNKEEWKAAVYQVRIWNEDNSVSTPYELISYRPGNATLRVKAITSPDNFSVEIPIIINDYTPELADYTEGTLLMNEEWYGHMSGGMNYATPDYDLVYQAYANENAGASFGCTSQFGMIWNDKLFVSSKQAADGGDPTGGGGRLVIADAKTLKHISGLDDLMFGDETRSSDGRALAGATPNKIYHGTAGQIYIVEMNDDGTNPHITGKVAYNEDSVGSGNNTEGQGDLYNGQIGDMVNAGRYVFGITQDKGVFMIDTESDLIEKEIDDKNVQGICQVADGTVWYATKSDDKQHSVFVCLDPNTCEELKRVEVPKEYGVVNCGWGAWRTTQFTGSKTRNTIFFCGGSSISNGGTGYYQRYDIDDNKFTPVFDLKGLNGHNEYIPQASYGSIRYDDRNNQLIVGTTEYKASGHYRYNWLYWVNADNGEIEHSIELEPYYWFFSHAIFPDKESAQLKDESAKVSAVFDKALQTQESVTVDLLDYVTDPDNHDSNIRFHEIPVNTLATETGNAIFALNGSKLTVTPTAAGETNFLVNAESNGRVTPLSIPVLISVPSGIADTATDGRNISVHGNRVFIEGYGATQFSLYAADGTLITTFTPDTDFFVSQFDIRPGVYVLSSDKISIKLLVK